MQWFCKLFEGSYSDRGLKCWSVATFCKIGCQNNEGWLRAQVKIDRNAASLYCPEAFFPTVYRHRIGDSVKAQRVWDHQKAPTPWQRGHKCLYIVQHCCSSYTWDHLCKDNFIDCHRPSQLLPSQDLSAIHKASFSPAGLQLWSDTKSEPSPVLNRAQRSNRMQIPLQNTHYTTVHLFRPSKQDIPSTVCRQMLDAASTM